MRALSLFVFAWTVLTATTVAEGRYIFRVGVLTFQSSSTTDASGLQCDSFDSTCDYVFRFCLSEYLPSNPDNHNCVFGLRDTSPNFIQTQSYTFTLDQNLVPGSSLPNPLIYRDAFTSGNPWLKNFNFRIQIDDFDAGGTFDSVDAIVVTTFRATQLLPTTGTMTNTYTGNNNKITMEFQFSVECQTNWYGDDCFTNCIPRDDSTGHYTCDENGEIECLPGYIDTSTNCVTDSCSPSCVNGQCTGINTCNCASGWTGDICDQCLLDPDCPADRATCSGPFGCDCIEGYSGNICQNDDDVCGHVSPCVNGDCANVIPNDYTCTCSAGYTGTNCTEEIDPCAATNPVCENGAACTKTGPGTFTCSCTQGWTGTTCNEDIDECTVNSPCVRGNCTNCEPTGPAVINPGDSDTVQCPNGYICTCPGGFFGDNCQTDEDACESSPCQNNGVCHDVIGGPGYTCTCPTDFTGDDCETDVDECENSPCLSGGSCTNEVGTYSCDCPTGFSGTNCEIDIDECLTANCHPDNTLECINGAGIFTCNCKSGYTGTLCDTEIDNCDPHPCHNGTCTSSLNDFECDCFTGWSGSECDIDIDYCVSPDVCLNGGTCVDGNSTYSCECPDMYTGQQCGTFDPCVPFPCFLGEGCIEDEESYICEDCSIISEDSTTSAVGCDEPSIVDPDTIRGNTTTPDDGAIIGGVIGGVVGAVLLLLLVICLIVCCVRYCICCCAPKVKEDETDSKYQTFGQHAPQENPLYLGTNTLLSNQSGTLRSAYGSTIPRIESPTHYERLGNSCNDDVDVGPVQNLMYAVTQLTLEGRPPLPERNNSMAALLSPVSTDVSFLPPPAAATNHYETIPALQTTAIMASGNYDKLTERPAMESSFIKSGKYDSLSSAHPPTKQKPADKQESLFIDVPAAVENPYVLSPGSETTPELTMAPSDRGDMYVMLPPATAFASIKEEAQATKKPKNTPEEPNHAMPTSKENPYEFS